MNKQLNLNNKDNVMLIISTLHDSDADFRFFNWSGINDEIPINYDKAFSFDFNILSSLFLNTHACIRPLGKYLNQKYSSWPFDIIEQLIDSFTIDSNTTVTALKKSIIEKKITLMFNAL